MQDTRLYSALPINGHCVSRDEIETTEPRCRLVAERGKGHASALGALDEQLVICDLTLTTSVGWRHPDLVPVGLDCYI